MTTSRPTRAQADLLRYFSVGSAPVEGRTHPCTYTACISRGWLEATDVWPYHETTPRGLEALADLGKPWKRSNQAAIQARWKIGDAKRAEILRSHGYTVIAPE